MQVYQPGDDMRKQSMYLPFLHRVVSPDERRDHRDGPSSNVSVGEVTADGLDDVAPLTEVDIKGLQSSNPNWRTRLHVQARIEAARLMKYGRAS